VGILPVASGMISRMGWRPGVEENLGYYVYLLVDPGDGKTFYVGKGTGERCFSHVSEAHKTPRESVNAHHKTSGSKRGFLVVSGATHYLGPSANAVSPTHYW